MPIALALLIRSIIQLLMTAAIYKTAEAFIGAALDVLPRLLSKAFGISDQDSRNFIHDFMIDQALAFGLTVLALRKKMPTIVAERLGFTSKGFSKFGFSATARTAIEGKIGGKIPIDLAKGAGYWKILGKFMGAVTAIFMLTQSVEVFAYRPQFFVNILSFFRLEKPARSFLEPPPKPLFSDAEIQKITDGLIKQYGAGFNDFELQFTWKIDTNFVKLMLEAATDNVFAQQKLPTQSNILKSLREEVIPTKLKGASVLAAPAAAPATTTPTLNTRVFTGILSQGALSQTAAFTPREDDLIENADELQQAAETNLAGFLQALPRRILYEIKLASRVMLKDGTIRTGQTQQIQTGVSKDGTPKFKTITNRFAIANIYVFTSRNVRSKIDSIVLGPVDIASYNPHSLTLDNLSNALHDQLSTSDISEIQIEQAAAIATPKAPITETPTQPPTAGAAALPPPLFDGRNLRMTGGTSTAGGPMTQNFDYIGKSYSLTFPAGVWPRGHSMDDEAKNLLIQLGAASDPNFNIFPLPGQSSVIEPQPITAATPKATPVDTSSIPASNNPNKCSAPNIANFFDTDSKIYPTVEERGKLYESFGLGKAVLYTGTYEQNLKLLTEFKRRSGCPGF